MMSTPQLTVALSAYFTIWLGFKLLCCLQVPPPILIYILLWYIARMQKSIEKNMMNTYVLTTQFYQIWMFFLVFYISFYLVIFFF